MKAAVEKGVQKQEGDPQAKSWVLQERSGLNQTLRASQKCSEAPYSAATRQRELRSQNQTAGSDLKSHGDKEDNLLNRGGQWMGMAAAS